MATQKSSTLTKSQSQEPEIEMTLFEDEHEDSGSDGLQVDPEEQEIVFDSAGRWRIPLGARLPAYCCRWSAIGGGLVLVAIFAFLYNSNGNQEMATPQIQNEDSLRPGHLQHPKYKNMHRNRTQHGTIASHPTPHQFHLPDDASDCITTRERLLGAIDAYLAMDEMSRNTMENSVYFPISDWCVVGNKVGDFRRIFDYNRNNKAAQFDEPIGGWNITGVTNLASAFQGATSFNQELNRWDLKSVTSTRSMFLGAASFDQDLSSWDTSRVTTMHSMFRSAGNFNQNLDSWNLGSVQSISHMLDGAASFRQDLCAWGSASGADPDQLQSSNIVTPAQLSDLFRGTHCPLEDSPSIDDNLRGPFCYSCG